MTKVRIQESQLEPIIEIRHKVLRENQPRSSCYYPEDLYKNTIHFAAYYDDTIIGSASIYKEQHPDFSLKQSWRIRGMAVLPQYRNHGTGSELLTTCVNHAIRLNGEVIWCNARTNAVKFYKRSGFKVVGKEFEIENIGPHFLLAKNLGIHHSESKFLQIARKIFANDSEDPVPLPQSRQQL